MYDDMKFEKMPHVYADNYDCYRKFFPKKNLTQSKKIRQLLRETTVDKDTGSLLSEDALLS